jgi:hypothetical protein
MQLNAYQVCILVGDYIFLSMAACLTHSTHYHHHLPFTSRLLAALPRPLLSHISSISDMSQSSSTFQALFNVALQDYKDKTGNSLIDHPVAKQLETCDSVDSITTILQEQAQSFREFRENDGKVGKALNTSIDILCLPSISSVLNEGIGFIVRPKPLIDAFVPDGNSAAIPTCECNIRWHRYPTHRMHLFLRSHLRVSLTSNPLRLSRKCVPATMH